MNYLKLFFVAAILASAFLAVAEAHSMLTRPASRGNVQWWGTCSAGAGCKGPCDSPKANAPIQSIYYAGDKTRYQRGQNITVRWNRQNHPGGFVRLSMVPFGESDWWNAFNNKASKWVCYETNCGPADPNHSLFGRLNGPGNSQCSTTFTIPAHIPDGKATLQWVWYGGGVYYAQPLAGFGEYYSCGDIFVKGGIPYTPVSVKAPQKVFQGGDVSNPTNKKVCKYWSSNKVGACNFGTDMPRPVAGDLLSQSLEPCSRSGSKNGAPYEFTNTTTY